MPRAFHSVRLLALLLLALPAVQGCMTVREEVEPLRETTLTVARSGDEVTLSWIGVQGMYYTVMHAEAMGAQAAGRSCPMPSTSPPSPRASPSSCTDRVPAGRARYYRLARDRKPLVP